MRLAARGLGHSQDMIRRGLIDGARQAYAEWQWRSAAVWVAYERWTAATAGRDRTLEFAEYRVALDLEERACRHYMKTTTA